APIQDQIAPGRVVAPGLLRHSEPRSDGADELAGRILSKPHGPLELFHDRDQLGSYLIEKESRAGNDAWSAAVNGHRWKPASRIEAGGDRVDVALPFAK